MDLQHHFGGGVYAKECSIPAGQILAQHKHQFDHLSVVASGTAEVYDGDEVFQVTGPAVLTIKAGIHHGVRAITDLVWLCIHRTDCVDPEKIDEELTA